MASNAPTRAPDSSERPRRKRGGLRWLLRALLAVVVLVVGGVLVALTFAFALSWVMASIGLAVKNSEAAQSAAFIPIFPLVFASSVFVPTATLPGWLRVFADHQPVTRTANAVRGLILGEGALAPYQTVAGEVIAALLWALAILVIAVPLAVRLYRRAVS